MLRCRLPPRLLLPSSDVYYELPLRIYERDEYAAIHDRHEDAESRRYTCRFQLDMLAAPTLSPLIFDVRLFRTIASRDEGE